MSYDFETIAVDVNGPVATLWLNRPAARNALNLQMCDDLFTCERQLAADPGIRIVVIGGKGTVFCAGADLKERTDKDADWVRERRLRAFRAYDAIQTAEKPHIAMVGGPLVGSGGEIAMACDFIYASDLATFRFPEAHWGTVGATQRLPRRVGVAAAKELLLLGQSIDVQDAYRIGLVQRCFPSDALAAETTAAAEAIARAPELSIRLTKRTVDLGTSTDLSRGIEIERLAIDRCLADSEWQQGLARFSKARSEDGT